MSYKKFIFLIYVILITLNSLIAFFMYIIDKRKAIKNSKRIQEKNLLFITIFNGAIGALFGRIVAHHKSEKFYFSFTIYLALVCQIAILLFYTYQLFFK